MTKAAHIIEKLAKKKKSKKKAVGAAGILGGAIGAQVNMKRHSKLWNIAADGRLSRKPKFTGAGKGFSAGGLLGLAAAATLLSGSKRINKKGTK
tara:strand:+ start:1237 stop:1518 length:282 start_codon:yes stop_codon:yes gene_type:complete